MLKEEITKEIVENRAHLFSRMKKNVNTLNSKLVSQLMSFVNLKIKISLAQSDLEIDDDDEFVN